MRRTNGFAAAALLVLAAGPAAAQAPAAGNELTVKVGGVTQSGGDVIIALYTTKDGFPADFAKAARVATVRPDAAAHTFDRLPAGRYVVVAVHDRNKNGKIDKPLLGPPSEPIALSNHPKIGVGNMPDFDKAKVAVTGARTVELTLSEFGR